MKYTAPHAMHLRAKMNPGVPRYYDEPRTVLYSLPNLLIFSYFHCRANKINWVVTSTCFIEHCISHLVDSLLLGNLLNFPHPRHSMNSLCWMFTEAIGKSWIDLQQHLPAAWDLIPWFFSNLDITLFAALVSVNKLLYLF